MASYEHRVKLRQDRIKKSEDAINWWRGRIESEEKNIEQLEFQIFKLNKSIKERDSKKKK